jgi:hypothetical protein
MSDFICFIPFSGSVVFDIDQILETASRDWKLKFQCIKSEDMYVVISGSQQLVLAVQNEQLSREFVDALISSYSQWSYEEIAELRNHQVLVSIRTPGNPVKSKQHLVFVVSVLMTLLKQEGAIGIINTLDHKYYPARHFQAYRDGKISEPDELKFLFVVDQNQKR